VPRIVSKKTCGVGGPGGPVHDGRARGLKEYMVRLKNVWDFYIIEAS